MMNTAWVLAEKQVIAPLFIGKALRRKRSCDMRLSPVTKFFLFTVLKAMWAIN
jgi:hypothetical protein